MKQKIELVLAVLFLLGLIFASRTVSEYVTSAKVEAEKTLVMLDAGHGGRDPGKVGVNNALEKDINLAIAKKTKELLSEKGIEVIMTREEDVMYAKEDSDNKKTEDMKARVEMINRNLPELTVSIHQNSYHEESVSGAQVFYYSHSQKAKEAAEVMQKALMSLNAENTRPAKANDTYYMLKRTESPTIIVECGFLSNKEEAELLITEEYQSQMAQAICNGITDWLE